MCGRYKVSTKAPEIAAAFHIDDADLYQPPPRFNVAPTDAVPCVRLDDGRRKLVPLRWGLLPFWAKDKSEGPRMINARIETLAEKPAFRDALRKRRCLAVSDGFYEWKRSGAGKKADKVPHLLRFADGHVYAYAGLWSRWTKDGAPIESVAIVTTPPNDVAAAVHDRMPLIFDPRHDDARIAEWLDVSRTPNLVELAGPRELDGFVCFAVDRRVGNVKNDDPSLAEPAPPAAAAARGGAAQLSLVGGPDGD